MPCVWKQEYWSEESEQTLGVLRQSVYFPCILHCMGGNTSASHTFCCGHFTWYQVMLITASNQHCIFLCRTTHARLLCESSLLLAESNVISNTSKCNIFSENILNLFIVFCIFEHVSKNKWLAPSSFFTFLLPHGKKESRNLSLSFTSFCFVCKTIYLNESKIHFTLRRI